MAMLQSWRGARRPRRRAAAVLAALTAMLAWLAAPAAGHAVLISSVPGDGAQVSEPLEEVVLEFNEPVRDPRVQVADPEGRSIVEGAPRIDGTRVVQPIAPLRLHGEYSVALRAVSDDDHPVQGELVFTYSGPLADEGGGDDHASGQNGEREDGAAPPDGDEQPAPSSPDGGREPAPESPTADDPGAQAARAGAGAEADGGPPWLLLGVAVLAVIAAVSGWAALRQGRSPEDET